MYEKAAEIPSVNLLDAEAMELWFDGPLSDAPESGEEDLPLESRVGLNSEERAPKVCSHSIDQSSGLTLFTPAHSQAA